MRRSYQFLVLLVVLSLLTAMGVTSCGATAEYPVPEIKYQGENCNAEKRPLGKKLELGPNVFVTISWMQTFKRDDITVNGAWVFAYVENGNNRVQAYSKSMAYSSNVGEGWSAMPKDKSFALSASGADGTEYIFASLYSDTLELLLLCDPLVKKPNPNGFTYNVTQDPCDQKIGLDNWVRGNGEKFMVFKRGEEWVVKWQEDNGGQTGEYYYGPEKMFGPGGLHGYPQGVTNFEYGRDGMQYFTVNLLNMDIHLACPRKKATGPQG